MEVRVAVVVPEPVFDRLTSFLCLYTDGEVHGFEHTVVHGFIPFLVARHPAEVVVRLFLIAEEGRIGLSAIGLRGGDADILYELILSGVSVGQEPDKVRGIVVLRIFSVQIAEGVHFVGEHVADAGCRAAGAAGLVEDGREEARLRVVVVVRARLHFFCADFLGGSEQRPVAANFGVVVRIFFPVHGLCAEYAGQHAESQKSPFHCVFHDKDCFMNDKFIFV